MAWTIPRTYVAGELMTAAIGNTHWRDNLALLKTSISNDGLEWSGLVTGRFTYSATVTVSTPVFDLAQTWNAGAVTFTALKLNVTDTASAAASLLLDLQVGGASKFKVQKDGTITAAAGLVATTGTFSGVVGVTAANGAGVSTALLTLTGLTATNYHGLKAGNIWLIGRASAGDSYLAANTDLFTATITGASSYYAQSAGVHTWNSAASVSAGAAISPVVTMTLNAAGNLSNPGTYSNTTAAAANMVVFSDGYFGRSTSSRRYKDDVQPFTGGLADLLVLQPVSFVDAKHPDGPRYLGFTAEDLDAAGFTNVVTYDAQGRPDAIQYDRLLPYVVNALRELTGDVDALTRAAGRTVSRSRSQADTASRAKAIAREVERLAVMAA